MRLTFEEATVLHGPDRHLLRRDTEYRSKGKGEGKGPGGGRKCHQLDLFVSVNPKFRPEDWVLIATRDGQWSGPGRPQTGIETRLASGLSGWTSIFPTGTSLRAPSKESPEMEHDFQDGDLVRWVKPLDWNGRVKAENLEPRTGRVLGRNKGEFVTVTFTVGNNEYDLNNPYREATRIPPGCLELVERWGALPPNTKVSKVHRHAMEQVIRRNQSYQQALEDMGFTVDLTYKDDEVGRTRQWYQIISRNGNMMYKAQFIQTLNGPGKCKRIDDCPFLDEADEETRKKMMVWRCQWRWADIESCPEGPAYISKVGQSHYEQIENEDQS